MSDSALSVVCAIAFALNAVWALKSWEHWAASRIVKAMWLALCVISINASVESMNWDYPEKAWAAAFAGSIAVLWPMRIWTSKPGWAPPWLK